MSTTKDPDGSGSQQMREIRASVSGSRAPASLAPRPVHFGARLREARERAGLTQEQLGQRTGSSRHAVARVEDATDPRLSVRQLLKISDVLETPISALLSSMADGEDPVNRRQLLQAATAGAVVAATSRATAPGAVGVEDVAEISQAVDSLRLLDQRTGGDRLGYFADRLVADVEYLLTGRLTSRVADRLQVVHGKAAVLAGWLAQDSGKYQHAAQHYSAAMTAAQLANDSRLTAEACAHLAFLAIKAGQPTKAIQCAQAGQRAALSGHTGPRTRALLAAREATGRAQLGDVDGVEDATSRMWRAFESNHGEDALWSEFVSETELAGTIGYAHSLAGQHVSALRQLGNAVQMSPTDRPRNSVSWQTGLALAHAAAGDPAQAADVATAILPDILSLSSSRLRGDVRELVGVLAPHTRVREVQDFTNQAEAAGLLA